MNERIISALSSLSLPTAPDVYTGTADEYLVFSYSSEGAGFADDAPQHEKYSIVLHYCCPLEKNSTATRTQIKQLIFAAFDSWPDMDSAMDKDGQDWIFTFDATDGVDLYG